jgi:transcriptional regulator with XRE-family HTH domain
MPVFSGAALRRLRSRQRVSSVQLARELNKTPRCVQQYESGSIVPPTNTLAQIVAILDVSFDDLFEWDDR